MTDHFASGGGMQARVARALLLVVMWLAGSWPAHAAEPEFDHLKTGFSLDGAHRFIPCESCHINGVFKGTPTECGQCHDGLWVSGRPVNHIRTTSTCQDCHNQVSWTPARMDHTGVAEPCITCHNNVAAPGKPPGHIVSSDNCDDCHITVSWDIVRVDHSGFTAPCSSCHGGDKPGGHVMTTAECDTCHTTLAWTPAFFDHSSVTGSCSMCHSGDKPSGHFMTTEECDSCHTTVAWTPDTFMHTSANYPGDHNSSVDCVDCHTTNSPTVTWSSPTYMPDCAGCHAGDYRSGEHKKYESPETYYTVSELRDCTGACHTYADSSMSVVTETRNSHHRVNRSAW